MAYHRLKRELIKEVMSTQDELTIPEIAQGYRTLDDLLKSEEGLIFLLIHGNRTTSIGEASKSFNQILQKSVRTGQYDLILKVLTDLDFKKDLFPEFDQEHYNLKFYHRLYQFYQEMLRYPSLYWDQSEYRLTNFYPLYFTSHLNRRARKSYYDLFLQECYRKGIDLIEWDESIDQKPEEVVPYEKEYDPWHNY